MAYNEDPPGRQGPPGVLLIGAFRIDPATRQVSRGDQTRRVSPKALRVLMVLAQAAGAVVSRDDLLDQVWPEVTVGEEVLTQAIAELRRAFQDKARNPQYIETVHKAGYRLLTPVQRPEDPGAVAVDAVASSDEPTAKGESAPEEAVFVLGREHKQVTVLDCALSGAAALAATIDAETMADTVERLQQTAGEIVERFEGTVAQWQGDGLIALFGAPRALEDHARRAVSAAMELMRHFQGEGTAGDAPAALQPDALRLSIGIHTGPAVVGLRQAGSREIFTAIGVTTETAKRLRSIAPPGAVLTSPETYEIVGSEIIASLFAPDGSDTRAFQAHAFAHRLSGVPRRAQPFLSSFVGRARELEMLRARVDGLAASGGQVVNIVGEPGIGKSRLATELEASLAGSEVRVLRAHCLPHGRGSPYLPLARLLREFCAAGKPVSDEALGALLGERLSEAGLDEPETGALLLQLLGLTFDAEALRHLSAEEKRQRTFACLHSLVAQAARHRPLVLLIEDLHWIDATSQAWLAEQVMRLTGRPILLLVTHRPGYQAPWQGRSSVTQIAMPALAPSDSRALIRSVPKKMALSPEALEGIIARAQGNPFFLEELAFSHGTAGEEADIPDSVQAVIAARIDRLPPADKRLLQIAAVIGARIPLELLARVDGLDGSLRHESLQRLQEAELLYERRGAPQHIFAFKHALTQEVAYMGLVAKSRRAIHQEIAEALEDHFSELVAARPEILARHLTAAGQRRRAVKQWLAAGRKAAARATGVEAAAHFQEALDLIAEEPEESALAKTKLTILIELGVVLQALKGAGAAEVGEIYRQARALSDRIAQAREGFVALWGLWRYKVLNAAFEESGGLAEEMLGLAQRKSDAEFDLQARHAIWTTARFTGSLAEAIEHAEAGIALAEPRFQTAPHYAFGGHDPICCARGTRAIVLGLQGRTESARREMDSAIALAESIGHRPSLAGVYLNAADLYLASRDCEALGAVARKLLCLGEELGFAMHINIARFSLAWCRFRHGGESAALNEMRQVLDRTRRAGGTGREPYHYALFADCLGRAGRYNEARCVINEVFEEITQRRQGHWAKSEAHRMLGEILLGAAAGQDELAEHHFQQARHIAWEQGALSLELRAACSLAKLWQSQGRVDQAEDLLQAVCGRFTESRGNADLSDARTLLLPMMQEAP
ncbi:AAA family ATPase [Pelagibius sp.]|uniref:AAA family ATPase n=1 Tax=Pelagibius sp. TaxID=1931238 RepID=UPI002607A0B0|nr:AAA family ATPase [Pelagibius sp.]